MDEIDRLGAALTGSADAHESADGAFAGRLDSARSRDAARRQLKRNKIKRNVSLDIAASAIERAREGSAAFHAGMPRHERDRVLMDPRSQLELAKRAIDELLEQWDRGME